MAHAAAARTARVRTPKHSMPVTNTPATSAQVEPTVEQIRQRAYELYLFRGERPGDAREDWLEAERELRAKLS